MGHLSYEESKKAVFKGLILLGVVTLIEVFFSLLGKGYVIPGLEDYTWLAYVVGLILIALSLYKAYFIIYEFMHMRYEVKGLAMTVLLPTALLIWAVIAFFQEGNSWKERRDLIQDKDEESATEETKNTQEGYLLDETTYRLVM
ncbi:MAG: cytochrome C oxidase subunit IV family protein [Chitinophagales bacterium]|nr:cytochrome C oxidase subunit IV family protein [Chitinophagales bacterium]